MRIYIAHNYGRRRGLTPDECEFNVLSSIRYGIEVIKKGHNPFIPNLMHFVHREMGKDTLLESEWHELVSNWLQFCDAILIASPPMDSNSGVRQELDLAQKLGKRIFYSIEEIPNE